MSAGTGPGLAAAAIEGVPVHSRRGAAEVLTEAGEGWLSPAAAAAAARAVVAAWVTAVNGDESALRALAQTGDAADDGGADDSGADDSGADDGSAAAGELLRPERRDWVIAPGPVVTRIDLRGAAGLSVEWRFAGGQRYGGPVVPPGWTDPGDREYVGSAALVPDESRVSRWRLAAGSVQTVDEYYGYKLTVRDETPGEYRTRAEAAGPLASTGLPASAGLAQSAASLVPSGTYRLVAWFAEHDHKFIGEATADVDSDRPPTRDEAQRLAEEAVDAEARQRVTLMYPGSDGGAEVRPALKVLRVVRLLAEAPPVEPAAGDDGAALDDFARRYAASRGLGYPDERQPAWRDPGPWFLSTLNMSRSRGLMTGGVAGGPAAEIWYGESARQRRSTTRERWVVARYEIPQARRAGSIAVTVRRTHGLAGGPAHGLTEMPRGLTEVPPANDRLAQRYLIAAAGGDQADGADSWASRLFAGDLADWLPGQAYGDRGAQATCFQLQGGLLCVYAAGWPATADDLDAFRERAAHIAAAVEQATRAEIQ